MHLLHTTYKLMVQSHQCEYTFQELKKHVGQPLLLLEPIEEEVLYLYLVVSPYAISAALIRKKEKIQWPMYYVSKRLLDAEARYAKPEKLTYALVMASRKV